MKKKILTEKCRKFSKSWAQIYRQKKKIFFCWFSIIYMFHAILNPKNEKKNFDPKFRNFDPPPNRLNLKFWNSDFARWWHLSRRFILEKICAPSWKLTEWQSENLQKWPNFTQFWLWTPIKFFWGKKSKFHFQHFLLNIVLNTYARFCWATMKTLGGDRFLPNLDAQTPGRTPLSTRSHQLRWLRHSGANNMFVSHNMWC